MTPIRIVIADDHPIFRAGLQGLLSAQEDFEVVGEAANGREAVSVVRHAARRCSWWISRCRNSTG